MCLQGIAPRSEARSQSDLASGIHQLTRGVAAIWQGVSPGICQLGDGAEAV